MLTIDNFIKNLSQQSSDEAMMKSFVNFINMKSARVSKT